MQSDVPQPRSQANWLTAIENLPLVISCVALFCLMVLTFADVTLRSIIDAPIQAATEITRILVAVVVFSALPVVSAKGTHISVDLLDNLFKPTVARIRDALIYAVCGLMLYWPFMRIIKLAERARDYGDVTEYLSIPMYWIAYGIALSIALTGMALLVRSAMFVFDKQAAGHS